MTIATTIITIITNTTITSTRLTSATCFVLIATKITNTTLSVTKIRIRKIISGRVNIAKIILEYLAQE